MERNPLTAPEPPTESLEQQKLSIHNACVNGNLALALALADAALRQFPRAHAIRLLKLQALAAAEAWEEGRVLAEQLLQEAELSEEQRRQVVLRLAELRGRLGERPQARALLETWVQEHPDGDVLWLLAKTAFLREDYPAVLRWTEQLRGTEAELPRLLAAAFYHAEAVRHSAGPEAAKAEYEQLAPLLEQWLRVEPEQELALCLLLTWTVLGQWERAQTLVSHWEAGVEADRLQVWLKGQRCAQPQ